MCQILWQEQKEWNENCSKEVVAKMFYCMVCDEEWMETNKQKILLLQMYHPLLHK